MPRSGTSDRARTALAAVLRAAGCVFAEEEADLLLEAGDGDATRLRTLIRRRTGGEPLEYVLGWAEFCGLRVRVAPGVFVPRARTAVVVHEAAALLQPGDSVVDLCCGAGGIGFALVKEVGPLDLVSTDIDEVAVAIAAENLSGKGTAVQGDLFDGLPARLHDAVDVIVANAPYVPTDAIPSMPSDAREHEPLRALDGGADGLDAHRRIAAGAGRWLRPGGSLIIEVSGAQAETSAAIFEAAGFTTRIAIDSSIDGTCVIARRGSAVE